MTNFENNVLFLQEETNQYVVVKGVVYFESDDLDTGQEVELVLLFTEGYPLEGPLIYLPNLRNTSDVRSDGKVTSLPKNWASSPILMELIEELFEYIGQLLEPPKSNIITPSSSSLICYPGSLSNTTLTSAVTDETTSKISTHPCQELQQLIDTEHQQFSSPNVHVSTHDNDVQSQSLALFGTSDKRTGFEEVVPKDETDQNDHTYSDCNTLDSNWTKPNTSTETAECSTSYLQTDKFSFPSTFGSGNKDTQAAQNSSKFDREDKFKFGPAKPCFEVIKFYKQRIEDEISCLNSDYLVLLEETENAVDKITDIEHEIHKCKHEINNICRTFSKSINIKSLTNLPIDEQVRTSEKVRLKAKVCAINDALSLLILALGKNTIHLKDFLENSGKLGREKFLLKYTARTKLKLKGGRG